jgi:Ca2+-binding RTX toxin-like protein
LGRAKFAIAALVVIASLALIAVLAPARASAATCTVSGSTLTFALSGESASLRVAGGKVSMGGANCAGRPTAAEVSNIVVTGGTGAEALTISDAASLAPGLGAEAAPGKAEIEIVVDLGAGADEVSFTGSNGNDSYVAGFNGVNVNADDDADITLTGVETLAFDGGAGNDTLSAGGNASTGAQLSTKLRITGGIGNDALTGGTRSDVFVHEAGADVIRGGAGLDTADYSAATAPIIVTVGGRANDGSAGEQDDIGGDVEIVKGGSGNDSIAGSIGRNTLIGGAGNDKLWGLAGIDVLRGGGGNDVVIGGPAADLLFGDAGADTFYATVLVRDKLFGGIGIVRSRADSIDARFSVEKKF